MANKVLKFAFIVFFSIILLECSFDTKTGIWDDNKKIKVRDAKLVKLSKSQNEIISEINPNLKINIDLKPIENKDWLMAGKNYANLSSHLRLDGKLSNISKYKFEKMKNKAIKENPLILVENYLITIDNKGTILKFAENNKIQWSKNIYNKKEKKKINNISLALSKGILYAIDNLGKYYALDVNTGSTVWVKQHTALFNSQMKVINKKILAVDSNNIINCFSTKNGQINWQFKTNPSFIKTSKKLSIAINENSLFFSNRSGDIANLDINTGELKWFLPTENTLVRHETNFLETSDIVFFKKNLFFSNNFSKLFSLDTSTGIINWILGINSNLRPALINNYLFTISENGYLVVVDIIKGKTVRSNYILDKFKLKQRNELVLQGFLIASNKVYVTTNLGYIIICSINSGEVEKLLKVGNFRLSEPYISNNKLYVLSDKSLLVFK